MVHISHRLGLRAGLLVIHTLLLSIYSDNVLSLYGQEVAVTGDDTSLTSEIADTIKRYAEGFNSTNAELLASEIYSAPVLLIDPSSGTHRVLETTIDVEKQLNQSFKEMKANGWHHSTIHHQSVRMVGSDMVAVQTIFSRMRIDGSTILPAKRQANFLLVNQPSGWRIIVACKGSHRELEDSASIEKLIKQKMTRYVDLLNGPSPAKEVTEEIYSFPRLSRSFMGDREHKGMLSRDEVLQRLDGYLSKLKSEGMQKITVDKVKVFPVSSELAFVDLTSCRVRSDGTPIPPADAGFSYIWFKQAAGWKMIATLAHGPEAK